MMKRHTGVGNRLLAAVPPADFSLLAAYLQQASLKQDAVLVRSGDRNEQVYFPHSGTISFMLDMPNGQTVATAVIGHEERSACYQCWSPPSLPLRRSYAWPGSPRGFPHYDFMQPSAKVAPSDMRSRPTRGRC